MSDLAALFARAAEIGAAYRDQIAETPQRPDATYVEMRARFTGPVPETGGDPAAILEEMVALAAPGLNATTGPRFFGWVIGGSHPAGVAADMVVSAWGQNAGNHAGMPAASAVEAQAADWLLDLLDLPRSASVGFVTGATMANFVGVAAARGEILRRAGWNVEADGLIGAPPITVILGDDAHATVYNALRLAGLGAGRAILVPTDANGAMIASEAEKIIAAAEGPTLVVAQAGQLNTGAFDPFPAIADALAGKNAWLHVDGAFGLWARAADDLKHLAKGLERADSWAVDGHKQLQTPYDCGYAIVKHPDAHRRAMSIETSYLPPSSAAERDPSQLVPELSRRARGFATWATIKAFGRQGVADMVSGCCALARRLAGRLNQEPDIRVVHDVILNQVAIRFGTDRDPADADALVDALIAKTRADGVCFVGPANWRGERIVRVSVSSYVTTQADIDRTADALIAAWRAVRG